MRKYPVGIRCSRLGCHSSCTEVQFSNEMDLTAEQVQDFVRKLMRKDGWKFVEGKEGEELGICPECQALERKPVQ